jgi:hypothetical protein
LETSGSFTVGYEVPWKYFERDESIQFAVACEVNFTHAARAQKFLDLVVCKLFADK